MDIYSKDYSELEGEPITWVGYHGDKEPAVVVGCDSNIGITIMSADKKRYLLCLSGPSTEIGKRYCDAIYQYYGLFFLSIVGQLRKGRFYQRIDITLTEVATNARAYTGQVEAADCPFSQ